MEDKIIEIVKQIGEDYSNEMLKNVEKETALFGNDGCLDSLTLVVLISEIESKVLQDYGKEIVIANAGAMSQQFSPFKTVETLSNYVKQLIEE